MEKRRKSATINLQNCVSSRATMIAVVKVWPKKDPPKSIPAPDVGTCVVELWRYSPRATAAHGCVDPLSLRSSMEGASDECAQLALDSLMENTAW